MIGGGDDRPLKRFDHPPGVFLAQAQSAEGSGGRHPPKQLLREQPPLSGMGDHMQKPTEDAVESSQTDADRLVSALDVIAEYLGKSPGPCTR